MYHLDGPIWNRPCTLGRPIQNCPCILGRPIRNHSCILGGIIQNYFLEHARQESSQIWQPMEQFADKHRQELMSGCVRLRRLWCLTILSPFRNVIWKFGTIIKIGQFTTLLSSRCSATWRRKVKAQHGTTGTRKYDIFDRPGVAGAVLQTAS